MKKYCINALIALILGVASMTTAYAKEPVWTFSLPSPKNVTVSPVGKTKVMYTITNNSSRSKHLALVTSIPKRPSTPGLSSTGCFLPATKGGVTGRCTVTIDVDGSKIPQTGIHSGPYLCESGSLQQCYQPSTGHELNITLNTKLYTVTPRGDGHETISPSTPKTVNYGETQQFTVTANTGYTLSNTVGGTCPAGSWSRNTYTTGAITANCSVSFSATINTTIIAAGYYYNGTDNYPLLANSTDGGATWIYRISSSTPTLPSDFSYGYLFSANVSTTSFLPESLRSALSKIENPNYTVAPKNNYAIE
ncbi:hypothetical protein [Legionella longbeachae]|uniref:Transmembrane protein (Fibronectin III domain and Gp5 C-terminal repeat) n=1 Tax=Legionella longbeachae serogroup 1 (strain NSW150) TaxID=661367 RepID=D3HN95_LEGLN|nr:hypothetical protein [Legionella longbeachae]VEE00882.1 transmembrane protein (fibronectin III domain and Gp5 C-terminal repeat) [Legionella oakridgensis]HBD7399001.1 hypothetical protein [Legionella pneumophila]ARB92720.1 hypothetical protein A6J40_11280 [Legionella longbeachae]EEZ93365.1 conserved hypothetical protein [Legionella longbeachae D-4968]QIN30860.1 hypothetical protein GCB94_01260 [Legionella longbeachae]